MSKSAIQARKEELAQKERLLVEDMSGKTEKIKRVVTWSLAAAVVALLGYFIYRAFSDDKPSKKKKKKHKERVISTKDNDLVDTVLDFSGPTIGNWLLKNFK